MVSEPLLHHLDSLSAALDGGVDLGAVLAVLVDDLTTQTPSFLGLQLTLPTPAGSPVTLSTLDATGARQVRSSVLLPLAAMGVAAGSRVLFFAGAAGAFTELAAVARDRYGLDGDVVVDGHLEPTAGAVAGVGGLAELDAVNQAIGVLIHHGHTPDEAHALVVRRAAVTGETLEQAALALFAVPPPPPPSSPA